MRHVFFGASASQRSLIAPSLGLTMARRNREIVANGQRYRDIFPGVFGTPNTEWTIEDVFLATDGIEYARLSGASDRTQQKAFRSRCFPIDGASRGWGASVKFAPETRSRHRHAFLIEFDHGAIGSAT